MLTFVLLGRYENFDYGFRFGRFVFFSRAR